MRLLVEEVLGHATVQGASMVGRRKFGVPPGGAFDPDMQKMLNQGLGNDPDAPVLELALCRLTLRALEDVVLVWSGNSSVELDGVEVSPAEGPRTMRAGSTVIFGLPRTGARNWIAALGGFILPGQGLLKRGDLLRLGEGLGSGIARPLLARLATLPASQLHASPGRAEFRQLFKNRYVVRLDSDRVGIRLEGPRMAHTLELPSEPATPGVVQITPEGLPIILGPDGPTIGGYPRAAVVLSSDLPQLAQLRPGDEIRFTQG